MRAIIIILLMCLVALTFFGWGFEIAREDPPTCPKVSCPVPEPVYIDRFVNVTVERNFTTVVTDYIYVDPIHLQLEAARARMHYARELQEEALVVYNLGQNTYLKQRTFACEALFSTASSLAQKSEEEMGTALNMFSVLSNQSVAARYYSLAANDYFSASGVLWNCSIQMRDTCTKYLYKDGDLSLPIEDNDAKDCMSVVNDYRLLANIDMNAALNTPLYKNITANQTTTELQTQ